MAWTPLRNRRTSRRARTPAAAVGIAACAGTFIVVATLESASAFAWLTATLIVVAMCALIFAAVSAKKE